MRGKPFVLVGVIGLVLIAVGIYFLQANQTCCALESGNGIAQLAPAEYQQTFISTGQPHILLDVRTEEEYAASHIEGAVNISVQTLTSRLAEIPNDKPVIVYCRSGNRSATAAEILAANGYASVFDLGGIIAWQEAGLPVVE